MKFVATKTAEQFDLQALHRGRERLVSRRTGIIEALFRTGSTKGLDARLADKLCRMPARRIVIAQPSVL